jgi:hypothetical protein
MKDSFVPLALAAAAFLALLVWRVLPLGLWTRGRASRSAFREAQSRIEAAKDDPERALALCDAADAVSTAKVQAVGARGRVTGLYLRAMRTDPGSVDVVKRVVAGLSRRPRALESLLWRHLGAARWDQSPEATAAVLDALGALYEGPLRSAVRARALRNARDALCGKASP